jgi:hypothetical protein
MRRLSLVPLAFVLAACTTPQERAARAQAEVEQMMQVFGPACTKLGYAANSDTWRDCVLRLHAIDESERHATYALSYGRGYWGAAGRWRPYYR